MNVYEARRVLAEEQARQWAAETREEDKRLTGYLFWCSEGCGFVERSHRCEQWSSLTYIPPECVKAIEQRATKRRCHG